MKRPGGVPGQVRIIGGRLRGSKLAVPDRDGLRPTPGRVRETLFNWLQPVVAGAHCLDLFAGSGALGIEALSRGAAAVAFVERDPALAAALRANLARLRQGEAGSVRCADAMALLEESPPQPCDLVFLDPPFAADLWAAVAARLEQSAWLAAAAWIYVESPSAAVFQLPASWHLHRESRAGQVRHALYRRHAGDPLSWPPSAAGLAT
ncbi:MAG TPA: 16S rRNA (guanine(966)-N(2))-methyltransferase RsmD [Rhodanobacteraceae bacterium]|nr:16S rRNA (guanine(966)-N(2))-methyltransferase RsmD [Rhodanobacteraceae bacterium]